MQKRQSELDNRFPIATPEFVMVHTFSHLLMNQLCFESGYGMSSVREKIYVDLSKGMCGVLIYTADSDSEGAFFKRRHCSKIHILNQTHFDSVDKFNSTINMITFFWDYVCRMK